MPVKHHNRTLLSHEVAIRTKRKMDFEEAKSLRQLLDRYHDLYDHVQQQIVNWLKAQYPSSLEMSRTFSSYASMVYMFATYVMDSALDPDTSQYIDPEQFALVHGFEFPGLRSGMMKDSQVTMLHY